MKLDRFGRVADDSQPTTGTQKGESGLLALRRPAALEHLDAVAACRPLLGETAYGLAQLAGIVSARVQDEIGAMRSGKLEPLRVDVDCRDCGAAGRSDLYTEAPHTAHAHEHGHVTGADVGASERFEGRSERVGDNGKR